MPDTRRASSRFTYIRKLAGIAALLGVAHWLFYGEEPGATLGWFALAWCGTLAITAPALRRGAPAALLAIAALLALVLVDDPNPLGWALFWLALSTSALLSRRCFDDALSWAVRLLAHGLSGVIAPAGDAIRLGRSRPLRGTRPAAIAQVLALPLVGAGLFLALFASANPVLGAVFDRFRLPWFWDVVPRLLFWAAMLVMLWPAFRPRPFALANGLVRDAERVLDLPVATLTLSLFAFNGVFALQNVLDLVFLWSGAALPSGVTLADYAHRGAYTLIATAILAGIFVLVALGPKTAAARSATIRWLLVVWVAQNLLLVASSALRLFDYVEAYSLTTWRIAALAWMALVATGLVLICWRLLRGRGVVWLLNANALVATLVLLAADVVDLGAVAARWNVDHARRGEDLDLCYIHGLGASALLPLVDLERRAGGPILADRTRYLRRQAQADLAMQQADWHSWTWRGARRLATTRALVGSDPIALRPAPNGRGCGGAILPPPPPPPSVAREPPSAPATAPATAQLTPGAV